MLCFIIIDVISIRGLVNISLYYYYYHIKCLRETVKVQLF